MKEEGQNRIRPLGRSVGRSGQFPSKGAQYGKRKKRKRGGTERGVFALIDWFLFGAEYEIRGFAFGGEVTALSRHGGIANLCGYAL